jgi:hypothetical protein
LLDSDKHDFLKWLEEQLAIKSREEWYSVTQEQLAPIRTAHTLLINRYGGSVCRMVQDMNPAHEWRTWKFQQVPTGFWASLENQKSFLTWAMISLDLKHPSDWAKITTKQFLGIGGARLLALYQGSMRTMLKNVYPELELTGSTLMETKSEDKDLSA